jgi:hypothetical protein
MATTNITYNNPNRPNANKVDNSNRFKINNAALNMMARNPSLGIGYIIGSMLGENYWGNKRNKRSQEAVDDFNKKHGIGADANGVYGVNNGNGAVKYQGRQDVDWDSMNKALDNIPRTPQQANKPAVTTENAGTTGGVPTVADAWNNMVNGSAYNPGNTTLFTNGVRNMGNVIGADANGVYGVPGVIGADANGVYGIPTGSSAPSAANIPRSPQTAVPNPNPAPIPYTAEQLAQIRAYGGFTPEELQRMGAAELIAPPPTAAPVQSRGLLASAVPNSTSTVPASQVAFVPEEEAAAMDRRTMFVPEEEAGLAEARLVANNLSRAAATPATATDYNRRFITPGHDDSLTWNAIFGGSNYNNPEAQARALEYLKNMPG